MVVSGVLLLGGLAAATMAVAPVTLAREVEVSHRGVAFGDIADVSGLPVGLRGRAAALPIATFGPRQHRLLVRSRRVAERARALMPALAPWLAGKGDDEIVVTRPETAASEVASARGGGCARATRPLSVGSIPTREDFEPAACGATPNAGAVHYDPRARTAWLTRDLAAGETVAAVPAFALAGVRPLQPLYVRMQVGVVAIEREVVALQPGRPGGDLFVKSAEGQIFTAHLPDADQ